MAEPNTSYRTCSVCGTPDLDAECPVCAEAWENRRDASTMTPEERAAEFRAIPDKLEIEFPKIHKRIEELVGRPVFTHELGTSGMAYLEHEILTGLAGDPLAKLDPDKMVVVELGDA